MNKLSTLKTKFKKTAAVSAGVTLAAIAVMVVTGSMQESAVAGRLQAESMLQQAKGNVLTAMTQVENTDAARKKFTELQLNRQNPDYTMNSDALKELLREQRLTFRLATGLKLTLSNDIKDSRPEFSALAYPVHYRADNTLSFGAMSDLHALSFVDSFEKAAPGVVKFTSLRLDRKGALNIDSFTQMTQGGIPELISGEVHFMWLGVDQNPPVPASGQAAPASNIPVAPNAGVVP
jgi:hypothetical protein